MVSLGTQAHTWPHAGTPTLGGSTRKSMPASFRASAEVRKRYGCSKCIVSQGCQAYVRFCDGSVRHGTDCGNLFAVQGGATS